MAFLLKGLLAAIACLATVGLAGVAAAQPTCHAAQKIAAVQERQVTALRKLERKYNCQGRSGNGFFSVCRSLANRLVKLQRQASVRTHTVRADDCDAKVREAVIGKTQTRYADQGLTSTALYCVRLSDGYFFPAPKSQFMTREEIPTAKDQCRFICNNAEIALYARHDTSESADMRALNERTRYGDLPTAFQYQENPAFTPCDHQRYYRHVAQLRSRLVTVSTLDDLVVPRPTLRPSYDGSLAEREVTPPVSFEVTSSIHPRVIDLSANAVAAEPGVSQ
jgi:hypothetical protein